jgi:hypothetical protein
MTWKEIKFEPTFKTHREAKPFLQRGTQETFIPRQKKVEPPPKQQEPIIWPEEARTMHLYIPGMAGYGKTSLMAKLALRDMEQTNDPIIIIDPKGGKEGLVERVIKHIPGSLIPRTKYISLEHPIPIDLLGYRERPDNFEKNMVKGTIIDLLQKFSMGNWGTTMQETVNNLVPTLLETDDATFLDIANFFESKKRYKEILKQISEERSDFWTENPPIKKEAGPILSRMSNFKDPPFSTIVGGKRGEGLNIADIIEKREILLVDLSPQSPEGDMLGTLILSRIKQAIFRRSLFPDTDHPICHVYADEFHNYVTSDLGKMLLEARSHNVSLCMANPSPTDLKEIWHRLKAGVSSYIIFKMDGQDAEMLASKLHDPPFDTSDYERQLLERKKEIRWWKEALAQQKQIQRSAEKEHGDAEGFWWQKVEDAKDQIVKLEDNPVPKPKAQITFLQQIPRLQKGEVVYVADDGTTRLLRLPKFPAPPENHFAKKIKGATHAEYLEKRTGDESSGDDTGSVIQSIGNAPPDTTSDPGNSSTPQSMFKTRLSDPAKKTDSRTPR